MTQEQKDLVNSFLKEAERRFGNCPQFAHNLRPFNKKLYYSGPVFDHEELSAAIGALLFGKWFSSGEHVHRFEQEFSRRFSCGHSVMVNSGSSANLAMLAALKKHLGWKDGDEIVVSAVGFPTTVSPIVQNGLRPVFADIEFDTLNFDLDQVARKMGPRTRALFVSPVLGNPPDMDRLAELAEGHKCCLLVDGCDSLGTKWRGRHLYEYALATTCSFYPAHHITTGEGGMVSSRDEELIKLARSISWWGRDCYCVGTANLLPKGTCGCRFKNWIPSQEVVLDHKYYFTNVGYNLKPLDLQGAIGLAQLEKFDEIHRRRVENRNRISQHLYDYISGLQPVKTLPQAEVSWFGVPIICPTAEQKTRLVQHFETNGIQTRNYFAGNLLMHPAYEHLDDWRLYPQSNEVLKRVFFVGCSPTYTPVALDYLLQTVKSFAP